MYNREIRDYEVSIWTLQDSFIAVLKASKLENKGHIEDPKMVIKDDGTREFSFKLPMYLFDGADKKENPIWYTVRNGNLLVNMRKIKVIFNKMTEDEEVFEFIITKVTENHEDDELTCEVECEGLAFHELGKIGYKISLNQDDFLNEYNDWADGKLDEDEPHATLNYWCDKVLKNTKWTYCVRMDWASYDGLIPVRYIGEEDETDPRFRTLGWGLVDKNAYLAVSKNTSQSEEEEIWEQEKLSNSEYFKLLDYFSLTNDDVIILNAYKKERNFRLIDKIYEDEYVSSWEVSENILTPANVEKFREKERMIDVKESNIYNITQTIAETFGVFCRYEYEYDGDYHIIGRRVVFYNNFIQEATGTLDLSYPYNSSHIEREMDGTDIITKMFVKSLNDNATDSGLATIMDTDANKSGEDYLLNFDYMYSIGTISQEQYDAIPKFERDVKEINEQLVPLSNHITYLENELNDVKADKTIAENSIALDNERLEAANQAMKAITQDANSNPDPDNPGAIMVTENRPDSCFLTIDRGINGRYIRLTYTGVLRDTLKLYETYDRMGTTGEKLSKQLESGYEVEEDEYGNITRIIINATLEEDNTLYATYSYKPDLYYENIKKLWEKRLKDDQEKLEKAKSRIEVLEGTEDTTGKIESLQNDYNDLITQKEKLIARFERMMGPALREGNWQPEDDYANYGDKKTFVQRLDLNSVFNNDVEISIGWEGEDELKEIELFDGEDKSYHLIGADTTREYYPFINLENNFDILKGKEDLKQYSFCFYDKDLGDIDDPAYYKYFAIGSRSRLGFLKINDKVKPVLFLSDTDSLPAKEKILNPFIGKITVKETEGQNGFEYQEERLMDVINIDYSQNEIVYPRIQICSSRLKVSEDQLSIYFGDKLLKNYEDYYINSRTNDGTYLTTYYITIKPEFLFKNGFGDFTIHYSISNTGLIMYLDAIQVLKENAYPQVSYTIDPSLVNKEFTKTAYKTLNKIAHINDYELKFENVLGYISELELDLDHPWEDSITITNYKTKFEDLFSTIVAQTEDMKKNSYIIGMAASAFTDYGTLSSEFMQNSINKPDLSYAFNNGKLTIDNENGIWGISDDGVVAMRGGGIFTANEQDGDGNWIWNTGILPSGINASLITTGQLDTNLIRIFAGDDLRFQMNGDGIFAYKDDAEVDGDHPDAKYYARYYSEGLFLHVDDGVKVADDKYVTTEEKKGIDRVELSWNGLILRDWNNEKTLSTDPNTGDLTVKGNIQATSLTIVSNGSNENDIPIDSYINQNSSRTYYFPSIQEENLPDTGDESPVFINGDLWINTSQKNKLYRFNGETWVSVQDTGLTNFNLANGASILSVIENSPYVFDTHKSSISLNTNNGLLIKGEATINGTEKSYPFFQVTSTGMGFFKYNQSETNGVKKDSISNLLYYEDGDLYLKGNIYANGHIFTLDNNGNPVISNGETIEGYITKLSNNEAKDILRQAFGVNSTASITDLGIPTVSKGLPWPQNPKIGDWFFNTSNNVVYIYSKNGNETRWQEVTYTPTVLSGSYSNRPSEAKIGDIYNESNGYKYIYTATGWQNLNNRIIGASLDVDAVNGTISLLSSNGILIETGGKLNLNGQKISILANTVNNNDAAISLVTAFDDSSFYNIFTLDKDGITLGSSGSFKAAAAKSVYIGFGEYNSNASNLSYLYMGKDNNNMPFFNIRTTGKFYAVGDEVLIATAEKPNEIGHPSDNGSYIWMHRNESSHHILDIRTSGVLKAIGNEIFFGARENDTSGSYIWMRPDNGQYLLDLGVTGLLNINSDNFQVHTNPSNGYPIFYVGDSQNNFIQYIASPTSLLQINGTIQADSGWLGGENGWIIETNQIVGRNNSNNNNFILSTNYNNSDVPALAIETVDDNNNKTSLILNYTTLSFKEVELVEDHGIISEVFSGQTFFIDLKNGSGNFATLSSSEIFANNIINYSNQIFEMYMFETEVNNGEESIVKINTIKDFISKLQQTSYKEAIFYINSSENTENIYYDDINTILTFENIFTQKIKIICDPPVEYEEDENINLIYNYILPPIKISFNGYFEIVNGCWYNTNENYHINTSNFNSFALFIDKSNAEVFLKNCWIYSSKNGIVGNSGKITWSNDLEESHLSGKCLDYFCESIEGNITSISGNIPKVDEDKIYFSANGGVVIQEGNLEVNKSTNNINIDSTKTASITLSFNLNDTILGWNSYARSGESDISPVKIGSESYNANTIGRLIELMIGNYSIQTLQNVTVNNIKNQNAIIVIDTASIYVKRVQAKRGANIDKRSANNRYGRIQFKEPGENGNMLGGEMSFNIPYWNGDDKDTTQTTSLSKEDLTNINTFFGNIHSLDFTKLINFILYGTITQSSSTLGDDTWHCGEGSVTFTFHLNQLS